MGNGWSPLVGEMVGVQMPLGPQKTSGTGQLGCCCCLFPACSPPGVDPGLLVRAPLQPCTHPTHSHLFTPELKLMASTHWFFMHCSFFRMPKCHLGRGQCSSGLCCRTGNSSALSGVFICCLLELGECKCSCLRTPGRKTRLCHHSAPPKA